MWRQSPLLYFNKRSSVFLLYFSLSVELAFADHRGGLKKYKKATNNMIIIRLGPHLPKTSSPYMCMFNFNQFDWLKCGDINHLCNPCKVCQTLRIGKK